MTSVVFTFPTTHAALDAEVALAAAGVACEPVPAPPSALGRCGIALQVAARDEASARASLAEACVTISEVLAVD